MGWLTALSLGTMLIGISVGIGIVIRELEPRPEYPTLMVDVMRVIGTLIVFAALLTGTYFVIMAVSIAIG